MKLVGAAILAVALLLPSVLVIPRAVGAQSPEVSDQTVYANFSISAVSFPWGLWSDGTTLWVAQDTSPNPKIHAYHLKDDTTTEADEYGTRDADKDFNVPSDEVHSLEADDDYLYGCDFSAGGGLFDSNVAGVVAWNRADRTRASSRDFAYRSGGSADTGAGEVVLCYGSVVYGDHIYLSDSTSELHAFRLVDDPNTVADEYGTPDPERAIAMPIDGVRGLHREGDILWVTGPDENKVYAIDMSDGARQGHLEFDLRSETTQPHGIWSNGVTFFVVSNDKQEIHTYRPPQLSQARVDFSGTIRFSDFRLHSQNSAPRGVWGNDATVWVANDGATVKRIFAYDRNDGSRDTGRDISGTTLVAAGNRDPSGICSDGVTMFVVDDLDKKVYAYKMSDRSHDSAKDISLDGSNFDPTGVWCDADTVWVANNGDGTFSLNKIFAYKRSDGSRDAGKDFDSLDVSTAADSENAQQPRGLWSNGTTMFVADDQDDKVYAFKHSDESQDDAKNLALRSANSDASGLWFDGRALWVVDHADRKLYVYDLPGGQDPNTPAAGLPSISGVPQRSVELTADVSGISDADGLDDAVFHYQWFRVDGTNVTELDGATGSTYTPTDDDAGNNIKVRVVFDDDAGHREYPRTSPEVGPVSTADDVPVAITSDPGTDAIYATGDKIEVTATLDSAVEVTGTPRLKLGLGDGDTSGDRWAEYAADAVEPEVLVKNTGQTQFTVGGLPINTNKRAQAFTTGATGYTLSSIGIRFRSIGDTATAGRDLVVTLNEVDNGEPGDTLCTLSDPLSFTTDAVNTFDAPTTGTDLCPTLAANTTYFVVVQRVNFVSPTIISLNVTNSTNEDTGGAVGWSIENAEDSFLDDGFNVGWQRINSRSHLIEVTGTPLSTDVVFSYTVEAGDESDADGISVGDIALATDDVDLNGGTITAAATGDDASFSYVPLPSDSAHRVNWARPTLSGAVTSLDGTEVFLTFSEDLNGSSVAPLFIVKADGAAVTVSGRSTVSGSVVTLSLATALTSATQAVTVIYADPTTGDDSIGVEDLALNDAGSFTDQPVTNRFWTVDAPAEVPANWAFVPEGLGIGDEFRVLFLTSATRDATSADIDDYNTFVQTAAAAGGHAAVGGYSHGFFAVASTADVDARDNTVTTYTSPDTGVPIYWLGGNKIADGYPDFYDGTWDDETDPTDESGSAIVGRSALTQVWTGSADDGTVGPNNNFGADSSGLGTSGISGAVVGSIPIPSVIAVGNVAPNPLFLSNSNPTDGAHSFYALSLPLVVGDALAIPADSALIPEGLSGGDRFRLLFGTSATRDATSTDIADYNSFVQTAAAGHADIADFSDGFRAVASTADVDARDNTETTGTGVPIYWLAGNKVADDYADFYDNSWDEEVNLTDESGNAPQRLHGQRLPVDWQR